MSEWRCKRFWYQGPPGFRGLYFYRDTAPYVPKWRPMFRVFRFGGEGVLFGSYRRHIWWAWRYPR